MKFLRSKLLTLLVLAAILILIFSFLKEKNPKNIKKARIGNKEFRLEIADTDALRSHGLSDRVSLPKYSGMLFVFDHRERYSFWMKDMNFPLDFLWVEGTKIADISENIANPTKNDPNNLPLITPNTNVDKVIEINAGVIKELNIKAGDIVEFNN